MEAAGARDLRVTGLETPVVLVVVAGGGADGVADAFAAAAACDRRVMGAIVLFVESVVHT